MIPQRTGIGHPILLLLFLSLALTARAAVLRVPEEWPLIQTALDSCASGDTVLIAPGVWTERFQIGPGRVTLCSNFLFNQDSVDIVNTVLDGQHLGTIITVDMDASSWLEINGLTITQGEGDFDFDSATFTGGGINVLHAGETHLSNLVFNDNHAPRDGASLYYVDNSIYPTSRVYLNNINCYSNEGNNPQNSYWKSFLMWGQKYIEASRLRIYAGQITRSTQFELSASDTLIVEDCVFADLNHLVSVPANLSVGNPSIGEFFGYFLKVRDYYVLDCTFPRIGGFSLSAGSNVKIDLHNIHLERNHFPQGGMRFNLMGRGTFDADSIFICNNESQKSYSLFANDMPGTFRNLFVIGNHMGSNAHFTPTDGMYPTMIDVSFDGALFQDNINERALADPGDYIEGGSLLYIQCSRADTIIYRNMKFINNLHIDHDTYNMQDLCEGGAYPNIGRLIYGFAGEPAYFLMDSCQFIANHESNMLPEIECPSLPGGVPFIGNNVQFADYGDTADVDMEFRNILFTDCDDGTIWISSRKRLLVENVEIINCKRQGLIVDNNSVHDSVVLRNILISGIQQQQCFSTPPFRSCYQNAFCFGLNNNNNVELSNVSVIDCDIPFVVKQWGSALDRTIKNSIFANNTMTYGFIHLLSGPISFDHCLLPYQDAGVGNLWGVDPGFDPNLGPPWLAPDSPCVDAGDPDPAYNDLEDPANPGFALWPSQGGLRRDIGFTGGPHAALMDTNWVSVPAWEPRTKPLDFSLGAPWPNPFNPATTIAFTLLRPVRVRLSVHNVLGQEVAVLADGLRPTGTQQVRFRPEGLASGLYLVTLESGGRQETRAVTLLR